MSKYLIGGLFALLAISAGLFWWQTNASAPLPIPHSPPPEAEIDPIDINTLPEADPNAPSFGKAPPNPPRATKLSREERRFNRYDLDQNNEISRIEMMSSRTKAFKKLDVDGNNLLSFEEWAVRTSERFAKADSDNDKKLTRGEFETTKAKKSTKPRCKC